MEKVKAYLMKCGDDLREVQGYNMEDGAILLEGEADKLLMKIYSADEQTILIKGGDSVLGGRNLGIPVTDGEELYFLLECGPYVKHNAEGEAYIEVQAGGETIVTPILIG